MKKYLIIVFLTLITFTTGLSQNIQFLSTSPESGSKIKSFDELTLSFDFSAVYSELGGEEADWGVCCASYPYDEFFPEDEQTITLFEGEPSDGVELHQICTSIKPTHADFKSGTDISFSFPNIQIKPDQLYTVVITYIFYAGKVGDKSWTKSTKFDCHADPLILKFYGEEGVSPIPSLKSCNVVEGEKYEELPELKLTFDSDISLMSNASVRVEEQNKTLVSSSVVSLDTEDTKSIVVRFPKTPLLLDHHYTIVVPQNIVCLKDFTDSGNNEILININGNGYQYFGLGRGLNPSDGSVSILDEIVVPLKLPQSENITYGFSDTGEGASMHIYVGNSAEGEEILSVPAEASPEGGSLIFRPNYAFESSSEYTMVIPEGDVKLFDLSSRNPSHQKEFVSERIELHYTTPSVDALPKWNPSPMNVKNNDEVSKLGYFILDCPEYEFDETKYSIVFNKNFEGERKDAALYRVTAEGEEEIAIFNVTLKTLDGNSEIGNGEFDGRYFVGEVNQTLYEGNQYKLVWFANKFIVNNPFIGKYIGNPEITVMLNGTTPTSDDFGLSANINDRLHSHADVFSFVTESEVKAGENAKMILKDGEENVAEAPVYVSREANGHRVYADFGGKKLESGKSYEVVLPEGSVYATNGIVNNPEIKSAITAMPEAPAAPEFISIALNIDEYASATYRMVKGQESVLNLKAGDNWKLESLSLNGDDVTGNVDENGLYTLPALDEDATLDAAYAYAREINYDFETGVGNIQAVPYSLSKDGSHLLISGLNGGEQIAIYTVGGMKIASLDAVPADMHEASIALPEGQVYIILINGTSIKWKH